MTPVWQDLRQAIRSLRHSAGFAAAAILMLGVAAGASIAVFSLVKGALLDPWPYEGADRIVTARASLAKLDQTDVPFSVPEIADLESETAIFEHTVEGVSRNFNLTGRGTPERLHAVQISASGFPMLGVRPLLGRVFHASEDVPGGPKVAVLSYRLWQGRFAGDPGIVGRAIEVEGEPYTVVGVMPRRFVFWDAQIYFPLALDRGRLDRSDRSIYFQARLRPHVTVAAANAALEVLARRMEREHGASVPEYAGFHMSVVPLQEDVLRDVRQALWILFGAAAVVLAVACANISNLWLARAAARDRDTGIRIALGAGRARILRQAVAEGLLVAAAAAAVGLLLAAQAVPIVLRLIPFDYIPAEADPRVDVWAATYGVAICIAAGVFFGLLPAARWRRIGAAVSGGASPRTTSDPRARRMRRLFLAGQIALAVVVTSSTTLLVESFHRLLATPTGFRSDGVVTLRVALPRLRYESESRARGLLQNLLENLESDRTIARAGAVSSLPLDRATPSRRLEIEGRSEPAAAGVFDADVLAASAGYFETLGIPTLAGRKIAETDTAASPPVAVINRTMADRFFPGENAVGRRLRVSNDAAWRTIVGVVSDVRQRSLEQPPRQALFVPLAQADPAPRSLAVVVNAAGGAEAAAAAVRRALARLDPEIPVFAVEEMDRRISDSLAGRRLAAFLLLLLTAAAIGLAALGTSAVAAYDVVQRRREIGIRMTLGARPDRISRDVLAESLRTAVAGIAAGLVLAVAASRILSALLSDTSAGLSSLASGAAALAGATVLASWVPARRAAKTDPAISIRGE